MFYSTSSPAVAQASSPALQSNRCLKNLFGMISLFSGVGQPWASAVVFMRHPEGPSLHFPWSSQELFSFVSLVWVADGTIILMFAYKFP